MLRTVQKIVGKALEDGLSETFRVGSRMARKKYNTVTDQAARKYLAVRLGTSNSKVDILHVDPDSINYFLVEGGERCVSHRHIKPTGDRHELSKALYYPPRYTGIVIGGGWDLNRIPHKYDRVYKAVKKHYCDGVPWSETEYYSYLKLTAKNNPRKSADFLETKLKEINKLYDNIKSDGYMPRTRKHNYISVNIGRRGELIFNNIGHHRLAISKTLNIDEIPVLVVCRHSDWEEIRTKIWNGEKLPQGVNPEHPDLKDIQSKQNIH